MEAKAIRSSTVETSSSSREAEGGGFVDDMVKLYVVRRLGARFL